MIKTGDSVEVGGVTFTFERKTNSAHQSGYPCDGWWYIAHSPKDGPKARTPYYLITHPFSDPKRVGTCSSRKHDEWGGEVAPSAISQLIPEFEVRLADWSARMLERIERNDEARIKRAGPVLLAELEAIVEGWNQLEAHSHAWGRRLTPWEIERRGFAREAINKALGRVETPGGA